MDTALLVLRVVLSLGLVLGVMWFVARRVGRRPAASRGVALDVVGRRSLGRRSGVAVVDVEGRRLVLGVSDTGVRLVADLGEVPAEPVPPVRALPPRPARTATTDFAAVLAAHEADGPKPAALAPAAAAPRRASAARGAATAGRASSARVAAAATAERPTAPAARRRPAHRGEPAPAPARRVVARVVAPPALPASPLAGNPLTGSVLDRATWTRARAVLTGRTAGP